MPPQMLNSEIAQPASHLKNAAVRAYKKNQNPGDHDQKIVSYLPLVHKIVNQVASYLRPPLSNDDLVSAGVMGLIKAARGFDPTKDAEFKTYAYIRIRGAVIDELRQWSFTPPEVGRQLKQIDKFCSETLERTGSAPTDEEISQALGISLAKLYKIFDNARAAHFLSINQLSDDTPALGALLVSNSDDPSSRIEKLELIENLSRAIQNLPQKQKHIVILYYNQQLTMKQIAQAMNLTESRVSQLHASALVKLSSLLGA